MNALMAFFADMLSSARETIEPISVALTGRSASSSPGNSAVLFETLSISRMIPSRPSGQLANGSRSPKAAVVASEGSSPRPQVRSQSRNATLRVHRHAHKRTTRERLSPGDRRAAVSESSVRRRGEIYRQPRASSVL